MDGALEKRVVGWFAIGAADRRLRRWQPAARGRAAFAHAAAHAEADFHGAPDGNGAAHENARAAYALSPLVAHGDGDAHAGATQPHAAPTAHGYAAIPAGGYGSSGYAPAGDTTRSAFAHP